MRELTEKEMERIFQYKIAIIRSFAGHASFVSSDVPIIHDCAVALALLDSSQKTGEAESK